MPRGMEGKPLELTLERVLWQSSVWIDGERLEGAEESLTTPHRYLIPEGLAAGTHEIMLRIDNRKRYDISWRDLAHSYTNDTQTIWNGVLGDMTLRALPAVEIAQCATILKFRRRCCGILLTAADPGRPRLPWQGTPPWSSSR